MARIVPRLSFTSVLFASAWLAGCVIPPKSSGELDSMSGTDSAGDGDGDGVVHGSESGIVPDEQCVGDCATPALPQWSRVVPTTTGRTWACDVEIDSMGRVALAWRTESTPAFPQGRTGIELMEPDGTVAQSTVVEGQTFTSIAFASDGTLRARGTTIQEGGDAQWAMALDDALDPTWSMTYPEVGGNGQCDWGWTGALVDGTDHLVTYDYSCVGDCPKSIIRRHAPDGTLLWEQHPGGNPSDMGIPFTLGADGSVIHGATWTFDTYSEVRIHKYSVDGDEQWMEVVPDELVGIWAAPDGGAYAYTTNFYSGERYAHRLAADGTYIAISGPKDRFYRVIASAADGSGFFATDGTELYRTTPSLDTIWSTPIDHADGWVTAATVADDEQTFALGSSNTADGTNYWLSVLAVP